MVIVRLARGGASNKPFYNIVVADSRHRRDGRFIERVGFYNPLARGNADFLRIDEERVAYWQSHGAQLTNTVSRLVKFNRKTPEAQLAIRHKAPKATVAEANVTTVVAETTSSDDGI